MPARYTVHTTPTVTAELGEVDPMSPTKLSPNRRHLTNPSNEPPVNLKTFIAA